MANGPELEELILDIDQQLAAVAEDVPFADAHSEVEREEMTRYLLVDISGMSVALTIPDLAEVGTLPQVTFLPNLPIWIQGIVNIRSEIISVVDLVGFLGLKEEKAASGSRLVVLRYKKRKVGIRIDKIVGSTMRPLSEVKPLDSNIKDMVDTLLFAAGLLVDGTFFYILNVPKLLTAPKMINYNSDRE